MKIVSTSVSETAVFAREVLGSFAAQKRATVLALYGDLGSGKTTFTQELGKILGVLRSMQSPTFVLMKAYDISHKGFEKFIHIDAYRLEKVEELAHLDFKTFLDSPKNLIVIEWAERVEELIPEDAIRIHFTFVDEHTRDIEVVK